MKKLLVPVDGSVASINAVKKSIEIARKYDFNLKLITVVNPEVFSFPLEGSMGNYSALIPDTYQLTQIMQESSANLLNSITEDLDFHDIKVEKEVLLGEPYVEILDMAKEENFDLIVMGNRGFSKIKRFFLGSVTQKVISEASCPVLVIHSDSDD